MVTCGVLVNVTCLSLVVGSGARTAPKVYGRARQSLLQVRGVWTAVTIECSAQQGRDEYGGRLHEIVLGDTIRKTFENNLVIK